MVWPPSVKGLLVTESVRGDGGILKNSEGKRFMFDYIPEFFRAETADTEEEADRWYDDKKNNRRPPELLPRDEVARAINSEIKAGRGSPHGGIFLDIASRRDADFIRKRLPSMYHQFKELADVDITAGADGDRPDLPLRHGRHRGRPRHRAERACTGLYAVGECSGGMHGSNRLGGNSLSDLLVFGRRAGEARGGVRRRPGAATRSSPTTTVRAGAVVARWRRSSVEGGDNPYTIQQDLQQTMNDLVGIIRTADGARAGAGARSRSSRSGRSTMSVEGHRQYNPGWHLALDLRNMLLVSECDREGGARAAGVPRRPHPRRLPGDRRRSGAPRTSSSRLDDGRHRRGPRREAAAGDARRAQDVLRGDLMAYDLKLRVWRGDAEGGELTDYTVEVSEGEVVLDALHRLQATQAGDLAIRWNCKAGKCGSCSAEINGRPRLLCMTRLSDFEPSETITVTPMRTFPVIRDLVTDVSFNYEQGPRAAVRRARPPRRRRQAADGAGRRRARPGVPQVHRVLPVPGRLPRRA